jgi:hypothetical protein
MPWTNDDYCFYVCNVCGITQDVECDDYELPDGWIVKTCSMLDVVMCPVCAKMDLKVDGQEKEFSDEKTD